MRELSKQETEVVDGGIVPAIIGGFYLYNVAVATYGTATVVGFAAGVGYGAAMAYDQYYG